MAKTKNKKHRRKTLSKITGTRGYMPPPTVVDIDKKKKNDRKNVKEKLKNYQLYY